MRDLKQELDDIKIQRAGLWNKIKELEAEKKEAEKQASHWRRRCYLCQLHDVSTRGLADLGHCINK